MLKLWGYECRRLLGAKAFLGMAAVTLWYARQSLLGEIIWGVADTAPFSPWSFGYYLAMMTPFLCAAGPLYGFAALLFFLPSLPGHFDATGLSFFQAYPVTLGVLDPPLQIPSSVWIGRLVMLLVGLGLFAVGAAAKRSRVQ